MEIRKRFGLSQTEMGEIMGLGLRGYQYIEHGERDLAPRHIRIAAEHLGISESEFYERTADSITRKLELLPPAEAARMRALYEKSQAAFEEMLDDLLPKDKK